MPSKVLSAAIVGLDAAIIEVEVDASPGLRSFSIVGLPSKSVEESKERIESAIASTRLRSPRERTFRIVVNLAPADVKKEGSLYDLPIALAFLIASKQTLFDQKKRLIVGELSLDGQLRPMKGALSVALLAKTQGIAEIIVPAQNAAEAALVQGIHAIGVLSLAQAVDYLEGKISIDPTINQRNQAVPTPKNHFDISWIKGQEMGKRALEITAAGGHNLFLYGPPGGGKSLLAKALPSMLPGLDFDEALEVTKIYSIAGLNQEENSLASERPFRSPHHISSDAALIGGGNPPRPGEITLAHRGVLFLDEFPEFHRDVLESLRVPMEEGRITVSRARNTCTFPSRFMLVAASNPCPCGYLGSPDKACRCSNSQIAMYRRKLSGPLMDRIDLFIEVPHVTYEKLADGSVAGSTSGEFRERITAARNIQRNRFLQSNIATNAEMDLPLIKQHCQHDENSKHLLKQYVDSGRLSARGYHRVLKVARTIADLANEASINSQHIAEALMYRMKD